MAADPFVVVPISFLNALVKDHEKHEHDKPCDACNAKAALKDLNRSLNDPRVQKGLAARNN